MQDFQAILDGVSAPVIVLNCDLKVVTANTNARILFPELAEGISVDAAMPTKPGFLSVLRAACENPNEAPKPYKTKLPSGQEFLISVNPATTGQNARPPYLVLTFQDRSPLRDAKLMRSDFVANVSHEIRSPLTAISGFVETLQGAANDDAAAREMFLDLMAKEATRMTNLVADLLSLSQVEVKERRALKSSVDLNMILRQAHESVTHLAQKRLKTLDIQVQPDLPAIQGKHDDLLRVFINLLENAINYSGAASQVTLTAKVASHKNPLAKTALCIAISDQGDGIPAAEIPRLTERFYRVDKSRSRNVGGTGLGLAIVKHILVRHRGKLTIESEQAKGSTFSVYLPVTGAKKT